MKELSDEVHEDPALTLVAEEETVDLGVEEETAVIRECPCPYCGHFPCGCGG